MSYHMQLRSCGICYTIKNKIIYSVGSQHSNGKLVKLIGHADYASVLAYHITTHFCNFSSYS